MLHTKICFSFFKLHNDDDDDDDNEEEEEDNKQDNNKATPITVQFSRLPLQAAILSYIEGRYVPSDEQPEETAEESAVKVLWTCLCFDTVF